MDDDGFTVHSRRRRYPTREPAHDRSLADFQREVPKYAGTSEEFDTAHFQRYGREEGLPCPGDHSNVSLQFPQGSSRQEMYAKYHACTDAKRTARRAYARTYEAAKKEYWSLDKGERKYYADHTDGLTPEQHRRLDPRAKDWRDKAHR